MKTLISTSRNISVVEKPDGGPEAVIEIVLNLDEPDYRLEDDADGNSLNLVKHRRVETVRFHIPWGGALAMAEFFIEYAKEAKSLEKRTTFKKPKVKKPKAEEAKTEPAGDIFDPRDVATLGGDPSL